MKRTIPVLLAAVAVPAIAQVPPATSMPSSAAAPTATFVQAEAQAAVNALATKVEENFVFPEVGQRYAATLRANLAAGKYASFASSRAFAKAITDDLQAVHADRHLRMRHLPQQQGVQGGARMGPPISNAVSKAGWLADKVAYIRFDGFPGNEETLAALRDFLTKHANAKTLIIDARTHRGGGLDEMDLMFPRLFAKPVVLVGMDTRLAAEQRQVSPFEANASVRKVPGPKGIVRREHYAVPAAERSQLAIAKVYLLVSERTASAGEHLALSLKRTGRATLIGTTTRGAGHYGGVVELGHGYAAFIPVGRTFDPHTGQGWEGVGVTPHVSVPADRALDEALKLAGVPLTGEAALASIR